VHNEPDAAPSDGPNMITTDMFDRLLTDVVRIRGALAESA
jgi:3-deoxy-D-manno-octulosonic acid (KDO) 8-phosphate synthase